MSSLENHRESVGDGYSLDVQNVVATSELGVEVDISMLQDDLPHAQYRPEQFNGLIYRNEELETTNLIFRTGKIVSTGADKIDKSIRSIQDTLSSIESLGLDVDPPESPEVVNVVCSTEVADSFNLNAVMIGLGMENVEYEPEQFPGAIYRIDEVGVAVLLFASGKVVVVGGSDYAQAKEGLEYAVRKLEEIDLL